MMDARQVWDMWRRILTDDAIVQRVLDPQHTPDISGLSAAEISILDDYAATPVQTDTNIGMYRRGLVRNALAAMGLVPLTQQLLYMSGLDVEDVAAAYTQVDHYADHGPNFWRAAAGFVEYLAERPEFAAPVYQEVLALDAATIALARRLGKCADNWPDHPTRKIARTRAGGTRFAASAAATIVRSEHDLTAWIINPQDYDSLEVLPRSVHYWLVYFPAAEAERRYAEVSERAARTFERLSEPITATDLSAELDGIPHADVIDILDSLAKLGVVSALPDRAPAAQVAMVPNHVAC
jgi:hypothetical protein